MSGPPDKSPSGTQGFFFNLRRAKFADPRTRRALDFAFDFEWTRKNLFFGSYQRTQSYFENTSMKATGKKMITSDIIPVISPIGIGKDGFTYNVNADQAAAEIARSLGALKLAYLTNVYGIFRDAKDPNSIISHVTVGELDELITTGIVSGGMIPKVRSCMRALERGVKKVHIINGKIPHGLLLEIFTDKGIGTEIVKK